MLHFSFCFSKAFFKRSVPLLISILTPFLFLNTAMAALSNTGKSAFYSFHSAQNYFDAGITKFVTALQNNPQAGWWLICLSFLYGVLHVASSGHGKNIISSYMSANNVILGKGILLSFLASLLQAAAAVILVALLLVVLNCLGLAIAVLANKSMQDAITHWVAIIGSALIMLLGLRLLFCNSTALFPSLTSAGKWLGMGTNQKSSRRKKKCGVHKHSSQMLSPSMLKTMNWKQVFPHLFSLGIHPCAGALIVMTFAMINHVFRLGVLSVLAMAAGTFLTVSLLAFIAVNAKKLARKLRLNETIKQNICHILEWLAALFIFASGAILLLISL